MNKHLNPNERLLATLRTLNAETDYSTVLQSLISVASELTNSEIASILKYDEVENSLRFLAAPWFHQDALQTTNVPLEESIAGWVYRHAAPLVIQDVKEDVRFYAGVDQKVAFETKSVLAVPLLVKGQPVGVFEAINKTSPAHYNGEDVIILETLASYAALIVENISLKQQNAQVQAAADRLEQMKQDFIAIASHELRTPLGLILGHATFLREVVDEKHHEQLDIIVRSGEKLKEIVENLSKVENFQSGAARLRMERFSLADLIESSIENFTPMATEADIQLKAKIKDPALLIDGDAEKIKIALDNLIKNALIFTPQGGHVTVTAKEIPGYAQISVKDDGIGIRAADMPHIFERFYQAEAHLTRQHNGMGLGLSIAKVMIELHGGKIWAESRPEKGSRFTFLLPLDKNKVDAAARGFQS